MFDVQDVTAAVVVMGVLIVLSVGGQDIMSYYQPSTMHRQQAHICCSPSQHRQHQHQMIYELLPRTKELKSIQ